MHGHFVKSSIREFPYYILQSSLKLAPTAIMYTLSKVKYYITYQLGLKYYITWINLD